MKLKKDTHMTNNEVLKDFIKGIRIFKTIQEKSSALGMLFTRGFLIEKAKTLIHIAFPKVGIEICKVYFAITTDKLYCTVNKQGDYVYTCNIKKTHLYGIECNDRKAFGTMLKEFAEADNFGHSTSDLSRDIIELYVQC